MVGDIVVVVLKVGGRMWWPGGMTFRWARGLKGGGANVAPQPGDLRLTDCSSPAKWLPYTIKLSGFLLTWDLSLSGNLK
jgi:hypothetical protein